MGHKTTLQDDEKAKILAYCRYLWTIKAIMFKLGRSKNVVFNFLKDLDHYGKYQKCGQKPNFFPLTNPMRPRETNKGDSTASQLKKAANRRVHVCSENRAQGWDETTVEKAQAGPMLTAFYREERVNWAKEHMIFGMDRWQKDILSEEKKLTCQAPMAFFTISII